MTMISFAQNAEDVLLERVFRHQATGFYVDVGAYDPVSCSITKHFYDRGWRGLNIEPSPTGFKKIAAARPRDLNLNTAISDGSGTLRFYESDREHAGLSTLELDVAERHRADGFNFTEHGVPVASLAEVVAKELRGQEVDFASIDVEGHEAKVIRGADWQTFRPKVLIVEATKPRTTEPSFGDWEPVLTEAGYRFVFFDGLNRFYLRAEDEALRRHFEAPANVFDDYVPYTHWQHVQALEEANHRLRTQDRSWWSKVKRSLGDLAAEIRAPKRRATDGEPQDTVRALAVDLLGPRAMRVADVGARWGSEDAWYHLEPFSELIGFEADPEEAARLSRTAPDGVRYVPVALGAEVGPAVLHLTRNPGCASLYSPNTALAKSLPILGEALAPVGTTEIALSTLDGWQASDAGGDISFIKIDVQGAELDVLRGAERVLEGCLGLELEVEFMELYEGQPLFHDVDRFLQARGFRLWRLGHLVHYAPTGDGQKEQPRPELSVFDDEVVSFQAREGRIAWGHALYFRPPESIESGEGPRLLRLAALLEAARERDAAHVALRRARDEGFGAEYRARIEALLARTSVGG